MTDTANTTDTAVLPPTGHGPAGDPPGEPAAPTGDGAPTGWLRGHRLIWFVAGVALLSLVAGLLLSRLVVSPAQAAADAEPPESGPITVPVEERVIANDVTLRADATFDDAVSVGVETGDLGGPAVVTGQVPEVGDTLDEASVALEVSGRPVIVLPGDLPSYRSLRVGVSGPDVTQLKEALAAVGFDTGTAGSDVYDAATAAAVDRLYAEVGYPSPSAGEDAALAVADARDMVRSAEEGLESAQGALTAARSGVSDVEKLQADNMVRAAQRALESARAEDGDVASAEDELRLAEAQRKELDRAPDTSAEAAGVEAARRQLADAQQMLADARGAALTPLPASEVLYLPSLPRRVDDVRVARGATVEGDVLSVSGADLVLEGSASAADAELLEEGAEALLTLPDDTEVTATVASVTASTGSSDAGRYVVEIVPQDLTPDQVTLLQGQNVRVRIPVGSTDGEVLAVPIAALTAGPGGESRVEVQRADGDGERTTELVTVRTGLAAGGYIEITSADGDLDAGDLVVVGQ